MLHRILVKYVISPLGFVIKRSLNEYSLVIKDCHCSIAKSNPAIEVLFVGLISALQEYYI